MPQPLQGALFQKVPGAEPPLEGVFRGMGQRRSISSSLIYIYMDFRPLDLKLLRMPAHMGFRPSPWCSWHLRKHLNGAKNHICEAVAGAHQLQGNQRESRFDELDEILHSHGPMLNCLVGRANACAHVLFGLRSGTHTWQHNELR